MSTIRELAESAYLIATSRPTSNAGIDVIEDAIQAAVNDHTRALADALEKLIAAVNNPGRIYIECADAASANRFRSIEDEGRAALRAAGRPL